MGVAPGACMLVNARSMTAWYLSVISFLFTPAIARQGSNANSANAPLTCDRRAIDPESYELATIGQARALVTDRTDFWDAFRINQHITALRDLNLEAEELREVPVVTETAFYEATGGCPNASVTPVATIPWSSVKELRSGNWVYGSSFRRR